MESAASPVSARPGPGDRFVLVGGAVLIVTGGLDLVALAYGQSLGLLDDFEGLLVAGFASFIEYFAIAGILLGCFFVFAGVRLRHARRAPRRLGAGVTVVAVLGLIFWIATLVYGWEILTVILAPAKAFIGTVGFVLGALLALVGGIETTRSPARPA